MNDKQSKCVHCGVVVEPEERVLVGNTSSSVEKSICATCYAERMGELLEAEFCLINKSWEPVMK